MFSLPLSRRWGVGQHSGVFHGIDPQIINRVAGGVVAVLLLIVCFYYVASLFWRVFYPQGFRLVVPEVGDQKAVTQVVNARGRWSWFADTAVVKREVAPSRLNANLIGVIATSTESGKGLALIKYKGKEKIYRVDDEVAPGIGLREIAGSYVILQRDDKTERLEIEKLASLFRGGAERSRRGASSSRTPPAAAPALPELTQAVSDTGQFREILKKEPLQLLNLFSFEQVQAGKLSGFSLSAKRDDGRQMLNSLGLKEGDVLTKVNGALISQVPSNPKLWKAVLKADKIKLKLMRNGKETEVSIN